MFSFKTLKCSNCASVIVNLPEEELIKLQGMTFRCECCNSLNKLNEFCFIKINETSVRYPESFV